ncbi:MAG TPA: TrpB-like pyridoxal phosphate-dependent enzyme [Terriglobia bacterium]|nr:TrpB-like pyridoxal phosphate-dependent enzyme [Terriglobia bacterium]
MNRYRYTLSEREIPKTWYNVIPDLPAPMPPPLHPVTGAPAGPEDLAPIFPMALIEQEVSAAPSIAIPEPILDVLRLWRPTPLHRAHRLEQALGTPAKIFYKYEGVSPAGSHKTNTSVAQAYYNKLAGIKRLSTETGAGQWGSALAYACNVFDIECMVYMVKCSYFQKPHRRTLMQCWGANCIPSPSNQTAAGRDVLAADPECPGSLGIAISEAVEDAVGRPDTNYSLGSVLNHVLLHQTVIGQEAIEQLKLAEAFPDIVIGCCGGGSNFGGLAFPFVPLKAAGKQIRLVAVEPDACPTMTKGLYAYDFGDKSGMTPLLKMETLGHDFIPPGIHAGGLRYHGMSPLVSLLHQKGVVEAVSYPQLQCFEAAMTFARAEGLVVAPETSHAVCSAIDEAMKAKEEGKEKTILFNLSGHGFFDMAAYEKYFAGELSDYEYPEEKVREALAHLPKVP